MIRTIILKVLKWTSFDFNIKHHYTKFNFFLNSYKHKGYWYYGKSREKSTIENFYKLIKQGDYVLEIGGHIGYFSTLFCFLVGKNGKVDVFEPSPENLGYLKKNISSLPKNLSNIATIEEKGAGDINAELDFYIDPITGQNNSFVKNFDGYFRNRKFSGEKNTELVLNKAQVITLDSYFQNKQSKPNFVKIDVEGFEWNVINGFKKEISSTMPIFMIEIQADQNLIFDFFKSLNYKIYNDTFVELNTIEEFNRFQTPNIFFIPNK